jgi:hypothetical protein
MRVFISWSGQRSLAVAEALRDWLPTVINAVQPYVTSKDLDKGTVWTTEIMANLSEADLGIVCLTADNLNAPWILFESGALAKAVTNRQRVCTYLLDLRPTDLAPPLSMFQATQANESDTHRMVETINAALGQTALSPEILAKSFPRNWPALASELARVPKATSEPSSRSDADKLDEILQVVRGIYQRPISEAEKRFVVEPATQALFEIKPLLPIEVDVLRLIARLPSPGPTYDEIREAVLGATGVNVPGQLMGQLEARDLVRRVGSGPRARFILTPVADFILNASPAPTSPGVPASGS